MTLQSQVDNDIKDAMRARETVRLNALRMLKTAMKNAAIEKGGAVAVLDDAEAAAVIRKQIKQRQDSVEGFVKGGRMELAAGESAEIAILSAYLPKSLSPEEVTALVKEAIAEAGATSKQQMGVVMKIATAKAAGRADGKTLSAAVKEAPLLNSTSPDLAAIVVAAGVSRRMGFDKLSAPLGGRPLIAHSLAAFNDCPDVDRIVLVCAADRIEEFRALAAEFPKVRQIVPRR